MQQFNNLYLLFCFASLLPYGTIEMSSYIRRQSVSIKTPKFSIKLINKASYIKYLEHFWVMFEKMNRPRIAKYFQKLYFYFQINAI